ncbi:MAG: hypothetical protein ACLTSZ_17120 [Lachnospiraceae bacterium]
MATGDCGAGVTMCPMAGSSNGGGPVPDLHQDGLVASRRLNHRIWH